ncbi:ATP-binding cassette domain-containing protein [Streptomyces europaeiscabiei]|uniref:ATP-binding cassette domain-containing protein n=1 Tax=Streptomyces europaeiscabiei TaxID=146819 RepID=A0AAJ2PKC3_9ACTN|nr:ATP-binding cassette domain-containing protein [Streptomyces europaeiscabiei]MDX3128959.1 ATP-binding cassette domain-containing protein [Streptomyces europaeiscabiei]
MKQYEDGTGRAAPASLAEITDLRVEVGGRAIVDGVSLRVLPGRVTALVGASGSGKTTTGLALLGEFPQDARVSGDVHVAAAGRVGYVPQHPAAVLNPARRITALLTDIARTQVRHLPRGARRAASREHVLRALSEAQLPDASHLLRRYPHQLSGGQQQRVVLAQALLLGARVIVADEPTTGQDALTKSLIAEQLAAVAARGIAVVLLSHDLDVVRALADEVHVMRAGRVVESGPTERVWEAPRHEWTRRLLRARTSFTEKAMNAEGNSGVDAWVDVGVEAATAVDTSTGFHDRGSRAATAPVLRVRDLTARHRDGSRGAKVTVRAPDLVLHAGELLAVVGRSGSGKTTLARCLAGLHRDHDGDILLDGTPLPRSLRDRGRGQLAAVQYVFQDARAAFDEHRPVVRQVARTAVRLRGVDDRTAEAEALTTLTGLGLAPELVGRHPARLSGGELQRAALARALLARPRVLICDEITSGLDAVTRRAILDVLMGLLGDGGGPGPALVLITHDLDTAAVAHRIAVMDAGELVEQGPARQILTAPQHAFTASLISTTRWSDRASH